jgi:hypothetical protein
MIKLRRFRPNYDVKNISLWKNINNLKILENNGRPAVFYLVMGEVFDQSQQIQKKLISTFKICSKNILMKILKND